MPENEYGIENEFYEIWLKCKQASGHPERYVLSKPHADRARQFKPFAALRGYEEAVASVIAEAAKPRDFFGLSEDY